MKNIVNLTEVLRRAAEEQYAVGSFSARYTKLIRPIIVAAMAKHSPVIVQLSEKEVLRHQVSLKAFADEFYQAAEELKPEIPIVLHLDHTKTLSVIEEAIEAGFTSVMIDASEKEFMENVDLSRQVVAIAHPKNVTVEAELGKIGTTDFVETDTDEEFYTVPEEAAEFCRLTGVDCLAVSVGTAHGVYINRQPKIDFSRIEKINQLTKTPLVLHGGSGVPSEMVTKAARMKSGGVSKVNIATELELAMLKVMGRTGHMTEEELNACPQEKLELARGEVQKLVELKISEYLLSENRA